MTARRYDTAALDDLIADTRHYADRKMNHKIDADYLADALEHYRTAYAEALKSEEQLRAAIQQIRRPLASIVAAIDAVQG